MQDKNSIRIEESLLMTLSLEDVLKLLPKRVKFISIWHYIKITRGEKKAKWKVTYGSLTVRARTLKRASIGMLIHLQENNFADIEYRLNSMVSKGYIILGDK